MEKRSKTDSGLNLEPKIIVVTGAESTGKSTLTESLAGYFNSEFIPEIARDYIGNLNRRYTYDDVETIALRQVELLRMMKIKPHKLIILDTWLIITKVWFEIVFGKVPHWIENEIKNTRIDLFLVCDIDLPWISDPVRENGGENRIKLHHIYLENLEFYGFKYQIISGKGNIRTNKAIRFINEIIETT